MSFFNKLKYMELNSAWARNLLRLYYKPDKIYRIPLGDLRGYRIRYRGDVNFHVMLGFWEVRNFNFLKNVLIRGNLIKKDSVIFDVGGNIATYSLWFSRYLPLSRIYAFEPIPEVLSSFEENIRLNGIGNVKPYPFALTDKEGSIEIFLGNHHHCSSIHKDWATEGDGQPAQSIHVKTTTLDLFPQKEKIDSPDFIKMDIEGGGTLALKAADEIFRSKRPLMLMECHTPQEDRALSDLLVKWDYQAYRLTTQAYVRNLSTTHPDPEGVWGVMFIYPAERHTEVSSAINKNN